MPGLVTFASASTPFIQNRRRRRHRRFHRRDRKAGTARRDAIGQILSYMGDIAAEESNQVRGILVADDFDNKARSAARVVTSLSQRRYRVSFEFFLAEDAAS